MLPIKMHGLALFLVLWLLRYPRRSSSSNRTWQKCEKSDFGPQVYLTSFNYVITILCVLHLGTIGNCNESKNEYNYIYIYIVFDGGRL